MRPAARGRDEGRSSVGGNYRVGHTRVEGLDVLTLACAAEVGTEARFVPEAGMVCCSLLHDGEEMLGTRQGLRAYVERHATMGIPLLYPWANRLGRFEFELAGRTVRLDRDSAQVHLEENGLPIHGLLAAATGWSVEHHEAGERGARLRAGFAFDEASGLTAQFPFPHELAIEVEPRGSAVGVAARVDASGDAPVPIAFGFHPYLRLPDLRRAESEISVPAAERLLHDDRGLPTGRREPAAVEAGPLGDRSFDDAYTAREGESFVLRGGGRRVELALTRGYLFAQLYAPPDDDVVAFEPMTAPTNGLVGAGPELRVLQPGERFEASFELRLHREP